MSQLISPWAVVYYLGGAFVAGGAIGSIAAAVAYWSRFSAGLLLGSFLLGGLAVSSWVPISGWAGSHTFFKDGKRLEVSPSGKSLWLSNRVEDYSFPITLAVSASAGLLAGIRFRRAGRKS